MKTKLSLRLALCGAVALFTSTTFAAQTWQTVDDFQYVAGRYSWSPVLAKDSFGNIFAAGQGEDNVITHALAKMSSDGGLTWSAPIDDFTYPGGYTQYAAGIVSDAAGNVYTAGNNRLANGPSHWFVRRRDVLNGTWSNIEDAFRLTGTTATPLDLTVDSAGNIYAVGYATTTEVANNYYWIVRKGVPNGDGTFSWSTVDTFRQNGTSSEAFGVIYHPTAGLFVVGEGAGGKRISLIGGSKRTTIQWIVRRSTNSGATWTTVDVFQLDSSLDSNAHGIGIDPAGNIYVVGKSSKGNKGAADSYWTVRKSSNGGTSWATVDLFVASGAWAEANAFAADAAGNLFVVGTIHDNYPSSRWLVRKNSGGVGSWSTIDDFQYVPLKPTEGKAIVTDLMGNVLAGGQGSVDGGVTHWLVRRLAP